MIIYGWLTVHLSDAIVEEIHNLCTTVLLQQPMAQSLSSDYLF